MYLAAKCIEPPVVTMGRLVSRAYWSTISRYAIVIFFLGVLSNTGYPLFEHSICMTVYVILGERILMEYNIVWYSSSGLTKTREFTQYYSSFCQCRNSDPSHATNFLKKFQGRSDPVHFCI